MDQEVVPRSRSLEHEGLAHPDRKPFFYGWVMVLVSFLAQGVGFGSQYFTGLFIQPFKDTFQASSAAVLLVTSGVMTLALGVGFPLAGVLATRFSIKRLLLVGISSISVGFLVLAYAQSLWQVALVYALFFAAGALSCSVGGQTLVSNWFITKRGLALGLSITGISVAGFVFTPLATYAIDRLGMSTTCLVAAAVFFTLAPLVGWLVVEKPETKGLWPDGLPEPAADEIVAPEETVVSDWTVKKVLVVPRFWVIALGAGVCMGTAAVLLANLMPLAQQAGIDRLSGSYLISCAAATGVLANIAFGALFDSASQRLIVAIPLALLAGCCLLLLTQTDYWALLMASALLGGSFAASSLMSGVLAGANFGRDAFALTIGAMGPIWVAISLICLFAFGRTFDLYATYNPILIVFLALFGLTLVASWLGLPGGRKA